MNLAASTIKQQALDEINQARDIKSLNEIRVRYLGKKGIISQKVRSIGLLPEIQRPQAGRQYNNVKRVISEAITTKEAQLKEAAYSVKFQEGLDVTIPGNFVLFGKCHPVRTILDEIQEIFVSLGFAVKFGPEVELDFYNFEALNIPKNHPARDMQDTFYVSDTILLRTHTSPVQIRVMETHKPPLKVISIGKVYRRDADISHTPMFHQVEGFMVDSEISMANLKGVLEVFLHTVFGSKTPVRFRPSYFPFTEPSAEVDIGCVMCTGKGCSVCKRTGWIEILGCGMINPKVFEKVGYDRNAYTGFAFGLGIERIAMLVYGIDDIRMFYENDIRFLEQF